MLWKPLVHCQSAHRWRRQLLKPVISNNENQPFPTRKSQVSFMVPYCVNNEIIQSQSKVEILYNKLCTNTIQRPVFMCCLTHNDVNEKVLPVIRFFSIQSTLTFTRHFMITKILLLWTGDLVLVKFINNCNVETNYCYLQTLSIMDLHSLYIVFNPNGKSYNCKFLPSL